MGRIIRHPRKLAVIYYLLALHITVGYLLIDRLFKDSRSQSPPIQNETDRHGELAVETPPPSATLSPATPRVGTASPATNASVTAPPPRLIVPVAGIRPEQLRDSFGDARGDTRSHEALDIPAAAGTPVIAAADGKIVRFFDSVPGGITIYQMSSDGRYLFYYAHLQSRAPDIAVGDEVKQGRTIGFVGDTGNAGTGNYHLHFSIMMVTDPEKTWGGPYINPFPLLRQGG